MPYPRATYPWSIVPFYRKHGSVRTMKYYRTSWTALRRWLVEHHIEIRKPGHQITRGQRDA